MNSVRVFQVDAFTAQRFTGNPAGVVLDAEALSIAQMRAIARELGAPDCAFVLPADAADHDLRVRFLTPHGEAPFIGHATLAVHAVLEILGEPRRPRQKHPGGTVRVEVLAGGATPRVALFQAAPQLLAAPEGQVLTEVLGALSLTATDLDPRCPPMLAGASGTRLLLGVSDGATLARAQPHGARLAELSRPLGAPGVFLFTLRPAIPGVLTEARMFCPALGIPEDPVSGNAHALLGAYLLQQRLLDPASGTQSGAHGTHEAVHPHATGDTPRTGTIEFSGAQGHHMQRPGRVTVALELQGGSLHSVGIIGQAVIVFATAAES
jgi:PhzF family phenazine biosynthesis protein